jgi:glutamate dehydrogenase
MLVAHSLMGFDLQDYFSTINMRRAAIVMCLDSADADVRILENYALYGIKNYATYISNSPPPFPGVNSNLRIATIFFTEALEIYEASPTLPPDQEIRELVKQRNPKVSDEEFNRLVQSLDTRFLRALPRERLILAIDMFFRAQSRDNCQYEYSYDEEWNNGDSDRASMHIVLAWRNTPKYHFLYRVARTILRHGLVMRGVNATYVNPYSKDSILIMVLGLHGSKGQPAWEAANIPDFLRELVTIKYFASFDTIDNRLVERGIVSGNNGNLLRAMTNFIHQGLVHLDPNFYSLDHIEGDICHHPELTAKICDLFKYKFHPDEVNLGEYEDLRKQLTEDIHKLDTGNEILDQRRKNVLRQAVNFVHYTLKTNFYRSNFTSLGFRIDPAFMDELPFNRAEKFPELPFGIFFFRGMHFFAFHIRFKDLARGGLRTIFPQEPERIIHERNQVLTECYNLAYTQHFKNKDIPEAGAKGVVFLKPYERLQFEAQILNKELEGARMDPVAIKDQIKLFQEEQKLETLHQAQRSFVESMITLVNCHSDGTLKAKNVVDYWRKPEYLYLGPDENMQPSVIHWIAEYSKKNEYKPGSSFISSKPRVGINHKEYGVTSLGVNVYMHEVLKYIGINPEKDLFTVKMSGGPDGDVAGNQIVNLHRFYPKTARLLALTDISGTIYDPHGLDLSILVDLFKKERPICNYPPQTLSEGGFLVDKYRKRTQTALVQQTLCLRKTGGVVIEDWLSGNDMNHLVRSNVHSTPTDVFIPAGGRPRTLNGGNWREFLDPQGVPTAKAIIEGANLYLDQEARRELEKLGVLIIIDSSANKTGVICSSFEVLCGLSLGDQVFMENKEQLVREILERLRTCALDEARLILKTHTEQGGYLSDICHKISRRINQFTYQLLDYLDTVPLSNDPQDPLIRCFFDYCLPTLRDHYSRELLKEIPEHHKKAIIACHVCAHLVYQKGLTWFPSIVDILPIIVSTFVSKNPKI